MFETRSAQDLIMIANAGGGFTLKAGTRPTNELIMIANAASNKGARLKFSGLETRSTQELVMIGNAGKGAVEFI